MILSPSELKKYFYLNPNITFLNFGSFGSCPKPIFETYQDWQIKLEQDPVQFITNTGINYLRESRISLANFINCPVDDLVFVPNPTYAVNIVAKSLALKVGDEIVTTNLEYGACDRTWEFVCSLSGAKYVKQEISLPILSKETFIEQFFKGLSSKTKLIFISHITSSTGLILPVEEICFIAKQKGILVFIDGAHVPGHIDLDIEKLNVDFYTGACHKWMMAPKGCSFFVAKKEVQELLKPLIVSWGYNSLNPSHSMFLDHHQMSGTRDFSAYLTIDSCLSFMEEFNWKTISKNCHKLVMKNASRFCDLLQTIPVAPLNDIFFGQMFSISVNTPDPQKLYRLLVDEYKIEIPITIQEDLNFIRFSVQGFNDQNDLDYLYESLQHIIKHSNLIQFPNKL